MKKLIYGIQIVTCRVHVDLGQGAVPEADGKDVDYHDVIADSSKMELMLKYSDGARDVPVIVTGKNVTIGFEGGS